MGHGVASGLEFGNCTRTHVTCDCDTAVLPVPMIFPIATKHYLQKWPTKLKNEHEKRYDAQTNIV